MGSHSITCHPTHPHLNPNNIGQYSIYLPPGGVEVDVGDISRWFSRPQAVAHPSTNRIPVSINYVSQTTR